MGISANQIPWSFNPYDDNYSSTSTSSTVEINSILYICLHEIWVPHIPRRCSQTLFLVHVEPVYDAISWFRPGRFRTGPTWTEPLLHKSPACPVARLLPSKPYSSLFPKSQSQPQPQSSSAAPPTSRSTSSVIFFFPKLFTVASLWNPSFLLRHLHMDPCEDWKLRGVCS